LDEPVVGIADEAGVAAEVVEGIPLAFHDNKILCIHVGIILQGQEGDVGELDGAVAIIQTIQWHNVVSGRIGSWGRGLNDSPSRRGTRTTDNIHQIRPDSQIAPAYIHP